MRVKDIASTPLPLSGKEKKVGESDNLSSAFLVNC